MYQATVVIKLQNFSGDANGNLHGNYGIFASEDSTMAFSSIGVSAQLVEGANPLTTLEAALAARTDLPTLTAL